jgi:hypothetical protein
MARATTRTVSLFDVNAVGEASARRAAELARPRRKVGKAKVPRAVGVRLRDALIRTLIDGGCPVVEVAEAIGRDEQTVYDRLKAMGLEPPTRRRKP